jgi:hypothetical protein
MVFYKLNLVPSKCIRLANLGLESVWESATTHNLEAYTVCYGDTWKKK